MDKTEFRLLVDNKLVQMFGYNEIEKYLQDYISNLYLKISAKEMLQGIQEVNLENDENWQIARDLAWNQEGHKFNKFLTANL